MNESRNLITLAMAVENQTVKEHNNGLALWTSFWKIIISLIKELIREIMNFAKLDGSLRKILQKGFPAGSVWTKYSCYWIAS